MHGSSEPLMFRHRDCPVNLHNAVQCRFISQLGQPRVRRRTRFKTLQNPKNCADRIDIVFFRLTKSKF